MRFSPALLGGVILVILAAGGGFLIGRSSHPLCLAQTPVTAPAATPAAAPVPATATPAPATTAQKTPANPADPVVASVNGLPIHFSDVQQAAQSAPQQLQQLPPAQLFPILVNQEIDRKALLIAAQRENLQQTPDIAASMAQAADVKLENAYVQQQINPAITDAAVQAEYNKDYAGKPGVEQVDARHILVKTRAQAESIIAQLNHGADFGKLAKADSIDPGASNGGELGWFSQDQMVPAFSNAAFALKPGHYTETPVQSQFGWHVILCEGRRTAPAPVLADVQQDIRQKLANDAINATLTAARSKVTIQIYNPDGTPGPQNASPAATAPAP